MAGKFILVEKARGPNALLTVMKRAQSSLETRHISKSLRRAWSSQGQSLKKSYQSLVPEHKGPYRHSHPNAIKYRRQPGTLRKTMKWRTTAPKQDQLSRGYLTIMKYTHNFLYKGTKTRKNYKRSNANRGAIRPMIDQTSFYSRTAPWHFERAIDVLLDQPNIKRPFK